MNGRKYTVITGASAGIGYEAAKAFALRGKNLIIAARRKDRLEALKREILTRCPDLDIVIFAVDLSEQENAERFYEGLRRYPLETWVNNAGFGHYGSVTSQDLEKMERMLRLDVTAVMLLSTLFAHDYWDRAGTRLINVSSSGGYTLVPDAVTYCAAKFFVSAFTEGLARELEASGAELRAKVFAPAATRTEFGRTANDEEEYDYDERFGVYHTAQEAAGFLLELYDSSATVGLVDRETFRFQLGGARLPFAGNPAHNQKRRNQRG